jgi:hypothetical protein
MTTILFLSFSLIPTKDKVVSDLYKPGKYFYLPMCGSVFFTTLAEVICLMKLKKV